jgi:adenosylmethionine-8-amino-7-oxononanoate aminotransferase
MRMYSPQVLDELIRIARSNGVVCIADEVFTGFGRTGKMFASDYLNEKPDIVCVSKGITGGTMPLGVTSCSEKIIEAFTDADFSKTFFHGHSYTANPIACAVANASYELLVSEPCQQQIRRIGTSQHEFALTLQPHPKVKEVRSLGTILAIELHTPDGTSYANEMRKNIYSFFMSRDILLRPLGNIIYVLPPYSISTAELNRIYRCIEEFLDQLSSAA